MTYYYDSTNKSSKNLLSLQLEKMITDNILPGQPLLILCIGSDRSTGDCLGPLIGYKLSSNKLKSKNFHIYGSLRFPVHAANLTEYLTKIHALYKDPFIIAIDASLGKKEHLGYITLSTGPLKPGLGVKKRLPEVGNIHITGIVNHSGDMNNVLLSTTRLLTVMTMADIISDSIISSTNVSLYKQQVPDLPSQYFVPS